MIKLKNYSREDDYSYCNSCGKSTNAPTVIVIGRNGQENDTILCPNCITSLKNKIETHTFKNIKHKIKLEYNSVALKNGYENSIITSCSSIESIKGVVDINFEQKKYEGCMTNGWTNIKYNDNILIDMDVDGETWCFVNISVLYED